MGLNRDFIGREFKSKVVITQEDLSSYESAVSLDSTIANILPVSPFFSATYELPLIYKALEDTTLHGSKNQYEKNMLLMLHSDQRLKLYNPIKPDYKISCTATIEDIEDRGSGEAIRFRVLSTNQNGHKIVESDWGLFIRGIGTGKRPKRVSRKIEHTLDPQKIIFTKTIKIPIDITNKYSKGSNDMNPIHLDEYVAKRAGLSGIVVHGMCTLALVSKEILKSSIYDISNNLSSLSCRFSAPVFPGDELEIKASKNSQDSNLAFHVVRKSDDIRVIRDGLLEIRD